MHEASLVQGLLNLALESWKSYNKDHPGEEAGRITELRCSYGLLACFEAETLTACFELFAEGTVAEGARLLLSPEPLPCICINCDNKFELLERHFICPRCGSDRISFSGGNGLMLQAINVESKEKGNG